MKRRALTVIIVLVLLLIAGGVYAYFHKMTSVISIASNDPEHATEYLSWPRQPLAPAEAAKYKATPLAAPVEQALTKEEQVLQSVAEDPVVLSAVRAANLHDQTLAIDDITTLDDAWYATHQGSSLDSTVAHYTQQWAATHPLAPLTPSMPQFMQQMLNNAVSQKLAAMIAANPVLNKTIVADAHSLNVSFYPNIVSDYYQGDEFWWVNAFNGGVGETGHTTVFTDQKHEVIKIYVPIIDPTTNRAIGVIMAQVDLTELPGLI